MNHSNLHFFCIICINILSISYSCKRDDVVTIPDVDVHFSINVSTQPQFFSLQAQGNSQIIESSDLGLSTLGYDDHGIIIYNAGGNEYYAFDCTCPYDFPVSVRIELDNNMATATCPVCHSQYVFPSMGMPTLAGPATYPLKEYRTTFYPSTGELQVYN